MAIRIILADDDALVTEALATILAAAGGIEVAAAGRSGEEAVELYKCHRPDLALLDIRMQGMGGLAAGRAILAEDPGARVLFLTTFADDEYIMEALRMGAMGYILKQDFDQIAPALRAAHAGQRVLGGDIYARLPSLLARPGRADLSAHGIEPREEDIIELVAEGLSNKEIAARLHLSEGTVRNYVSVVLEKLALRDRTQLAIFYYRNGPGTGGREL